MRSVALLAVAGAAACLGAAALAQGGFLPQRAADKAVAARPTYHRDVKPILDGRCIGCHQIGGIGPFSLKTYRNAFLHRKEIARAVARRIMPPWRAEPGHRRYRFDFSLSGAQIATIKRWAAQGAPKGNPAKKGKPLPPVERPRFSRTDALLRMPAAYKPRGADDYRCFLLPWTPDRPLYVTGVGVAPGTPSQVHHVVVVAADPALAQTMEAYDQSIDGPGFGCSAGGTTGAVPGLQLVGGWSPGNGNGTDLPAGTGIRLTPGSRIMVQVHYHPMHGGRHALPDRTRVALKLDAEAKPAAWMAVTDLRWLLSADRFRIPVGKKNVVYSFTGDPREIAPFGTGGVDVSNGFSVHAAAMHMHYLGTGGRIAIRRPGSTAWETLLAINNWDFRWQAAFFFKERASFGRDDIMRLECRWDNTAANQPVLNGVQRKPRLVTWGEGTLDEMCVGYLYVSEP